MILFGLRDVGSGNACLPVVTILKNKGIPVSVYAEGSAYKRFKDKFILISKREIDDLLDFVNPSLVAVTTGQVGGAVPIDLTHKAKQRNLSVILVEDMWSAHSAFRWDVLPDCVCVLDEFSKKLILRSWPGYLESSIHITGIPTFDKLSNIRTETAKQKLREILDIRENRPVIFFPGQVWGMTQAIPMLIEALNGLNTPVYLILRDHPTITLSQASDEYKLIYLEYREALKNLRRGTIVGSDNLTSDEVLAGSDVVVGMYSTMTVEACYMRKPVLIIWTPEISQSLSKALNNTLTEWPIMNLGASLRAGNVQEIRDCLLRIFNGDAANILEAQQKHFQADGLSADRITKVILSYYENIYR